MHINDIPVELLSEIFECSVIRDYLSGNDFVPLLQFFHTRSSPTNLIRVCRHWRKVAFSSVNLWTHLSGVQWKPFRTSVSEMMHWLQYSRDAPLNFRLSSSEDFSGPTFDPHHSQKMLRLFSEHLSRWQTLSIEPDTNLTMDLVSLLQEAEENVPPLIGLEIDLTYEQVPQTVIDSLIYQIHRLKNVRQVFWTSWHYGWGIPALPWGQHKDVTLYSSFAVEDSAAFLAQCISATSVTLHGWRNPEYCHSSLSLLPIILPHLTSLTLDKSSDPLSILPNFTLPSLRSLEIGIYQRDFHALEKFLERSKCDLQVLIVIDITIPAHEIADFFKFPWLKPILNVKLGLTHDDKQMLQILKYFEKTRTLLPPLCAWREVSAYWPKFIGWRESGRRWTEYSYENAKLIHCSQF